MAGAKRTSEHRGRGSTSSTLRVLATLVALLLAASSLSQVAHFLLVPHAICAEHGELLELEERPAHVAAERGGADTDHARASGSEAAAHDHCQILARSQRYQGLPPAPALTLAPATATQEVGWLDNASSPNATLTRLSVAPKTSPPLVSQV